MSAYSQFATNPELEKSGVILDYGTYYLRIARAGGANKVFEKAMKRLFDPHRRAIQTETMPPAKFESLMRQAYAEAVVVGWGYKKDVEDAKFIDGKFEALDGEGEEVVLDFSVDNVVKVLADLPELFRDVQEQATKINLFKQDIRKADAKN